MKYPADNASEGTAQIREWITGSGGGGPSPRAARRHFTPAGRAGHPARRSSGRKGNAMIDSECATGSIAVSAFEVAILAFLRQHPATSAELNKMFGWPGNDDVTATVSRLTGRKFVHDFCGCFWCTGAGAEFLDAHSVVLWMCSAADEEDDGRPDGDRVPDDELRRVHFRKVQQSFAGGC